MRSCRHLTPRYLWDRILWKSRHWIAPGAPYLNAEITRLLDDLIRPDHTGLETGAGASTVWFARHCGALISVEHDPRWARWVRGELVQHGLDARVDLRLCERTEAGTPASYVETVAAQPENSLDFVLIDGKKRDSCALAALHALKPGGLMIVDDVHRYLPTPRPSRAPFARRPQDGHASVKWREFDTVTGHWARVWRTDGVSDTALWIKPCSR